MKSLVGVIGSTCTPAVGGHTAPMDWRTRITTDPAVCHGKACIKGTRIMASVVLDNLAADQSPNEILRLYPTLRREDVTAVMAYAAELARERVVKLLPGHPEGFSDAMGNLYRGSSAAIDGEPFDSGAFPGIDAGGRGMPIIEAV